MKPIYNLKLLALLLALAGLLFTTAIVSAHERRDVGEYQFVVGFIVEPPYEGVKNGVDLRITRVDGSSPVTGAEATLQVEVTHVPSDVSRVFSLRTIFNDPGHYTADLIPTASGHYRMRFFGVIRDGDREHPVDETFESRAGGGNFNDVQPSVDLQFPQAVPEARELEAAARGAQNVAQAAQATALQAQASVQDAAGRASTANTLAIVAILLGLVGSGAGIGGVVVARRKSTN
ncbi:MAG: hypothetical protein HY532_08350 [Chloroflexi bacterium]|nr:hypothetical protein [Chloroflexota bacterium]